MNLPVRGTAAFAHLAEFRTISPTAIGNRIRSSKRVSPKETSVQNLGSFLDLLRAEDELVTVEAPVDPDLEIAEIHRRVIASGGPALLFTRVKGSRLPLRDQSLRHHQTRRPGLRQAA